MDLAKTLPVARRRIASRAPGVRTASFGARNVWHPLAALALLVALGGCVAPADDATGRVAVGLAAPSTDPLIAFVSGTAPGAEGSDLGGGSSRFRLARSYSAASGAECREVQEVAGGGVERVRLVCRDPNGVWREARPLLSNASSRP